MEVDIRMNESKSILILGSSGFVGSALADYLKQNGFVVYGVGRRNLNVDYNYIQLDLFSNSALDEFLSVLKGNKIKYLINCVGGGKVSTSTKKGANALINYNMGVFPFLEGVLRSNIGVEKAIHLGSVSSYGVRLNEEISESAEKRPVTPHEVAKYKAELKFKEICESASVPWIIFQPAQVFGPGDNLSEIYKIFKFVSKFGIFPIIGKGNNFMVPLVYVKDVAKIVLSAIDSNTENDEFILAWERKLWSDFANMVCNSLNAKILHIPVFVFKGLVWAQDKAFKLFSKEPLFSFGRVDYVLNNRLYNSSKAIRVFNFSPTDINLAIQETIGSYEFKRMV